MATLLVAVCFTARAEFLVREVCFTAAIQGRQSATEPKLDDETTLPMV
jgi:hypothetical protein